ncbi:hypothetical protein BH20ACI2_BH20ACI2_25150 [soil metagenome]
MKTHRPSTFFAAVAAAVLLTTLVTITSFRDATAGPHVQEMRGTWYGFIQGGHNPVESAIAEITEQENRRFSGIIDVGGPHVIEGTVSASGKVNYQGKTSSGKIIGKAELHDFGGGAAILDGTLTRPSTDDRFIIPCVRVLRAFAAFQDAAAPTGRYVGEINGGGEITILLTQPPEPVSPTSLGGGLDVVIDGVTHTFQLIGTFNANGRIIAIGHKPTHGHLIFDAEVFEPADPNQASLIVGSIEMELGDGSVREVDFQAGLTREVDPIAR